jgi:hypothetical protein
MKVARSAMWGSLASCGGLAIRPPGVGAQPNLHKRLSRVRRIGNPPARCEASQPALAALPSRDRWIADPPDPEGTPDNPPNNLLPIPAPWRDNPGFPRAGKSISRQAAKRAKKTKEFFFAAFAPWRDNPFFGRVGRTISRQAAKRAKKTREFFFAAFAPWRDNPFFGRLGKSISRQAAKRAKKTKEFFFAAFAPWRDNPLFPRQWCFNTSATQPPCNRPRSRPSRFPATWAPEILARGRRGPHRRSRTCTALPPLFRATLCLAFG